MHQAWSNRLKGSGEGTERESVMERRAPHGSRNENPKSPMRRVAGCGIEGWDGDGFVRCARKTGGESESWDGVWRRGEMSFSRDGARCSGPQNLR